MMSLIYAYDNAVLEFDDLFVYLLLLEIFE